MPWLASWQVYRAQGIGGGTFRQSVISPIETVKAAFRAGGD